MGTITEINLNCPECDGDAVSIYDTGLHNGCQFICLAENCGYYMETIKKHLSKEEWKEIAEPWLELEE
jgi:hypothetical protein